MFDGETQKNNITELAVKQNDIPQISKEYIRGLIDGEGCFTFYPAKRKCHGKILNTRIPTFTLRMHIRDTELIKMVKNKLGIKSKIYVFKSWNKDGYNRGDQAAIIVRGFGELKNLIVPVFYNKLRGYKGVQFITWLEKIGSDPRVPDYYKLLYRLHKCGYFDKVSKTLD